MNRPEYVTPERLHQFIATAIAEDIGEGDHSTLAAVPKDAKNRARLIIKEDCVLAGVDVALEILRYYDSSLKVEQFKHDGDEVKVGEVAFTVEGTARSILSTERLLLNCMQRMSGIATLARQMSGLLAGTGTKLLDTRKTTPNFRMCEKWAVSIGGATNHRYGLFDMVMLKDNHVDYAGGIAQAVASTVAYLKEHGKKLKIELETRTIQEVKEALATGAVDIIMLDNMSLETMTEAVQLIGNKALTEASGGITAQSLKAIAQTGVNFISSGAVIYAAQTKDMSLKAY